MRANHKRAALLGFGYLIGLSAGQVALPLWLAYAPILVFAAVAAHTTVLDN